jgi:hypothetical protein
VLLEQHRRGHNDDRPHSSLNFQTPNTFVHEWFLRNRGEGQDQTINPGLS